MYTGRLRGCSSGLSHHVAFNYVKCCGFDTHVIQHFVRSIKCMFLNSPRMFLMRGEAFSKKEKKSPKNCIN